MAVRSGFMGRSVLSSSKLKGEPSRQKLKTFQIVRANDLEVSAVSRENGFCTQPFSYCNHCCIHKIDPRIGLLLKKLR
jgi:hypothetical protein